MTSSVWFVIGTRPEATKGWLFARNLASASGIKLKLVFTGQHTDLLADCMRDLGPIQAATTAAPEGMVSDGRWQEAFSDRFEALAFEERPGVICALGDTDSVRVAAELARRHCIPIIHLEAGIRHQGSYETAEPEEVNRRRISKLATLHLAPTPEARANLLREGVEVGAIRQVGDLSACAITCAFEGLTARIVAGEASGIDRTWGPYALCTFHRSTSLWAQEELLKHFLDAARLFKDLMLVLVGRPDSRWFEFYRQVDSVNNVYVTQAMSPSLFLSHLLHCEFVLTDSAGVQQEAVILGKDVIACRREIELYAGHPRVHMVPPPFASLPGAVSSLWPNKRAAFRGEVEPRLSHVRSEGRRLASEMARVVVSLASHA